MMPEQRERLLRFRAEHPCQQLAAGGVSWEYIACGMGAETLLLLNGGLRIAETAFAYVQAFETAYRVIVPTYPPLWRIDELTDGLVAILDAERVQQALVFGQSYGGMVAQVLIQHYPARVKKLVLSGTGPLLAPPAQKIVLYAMLVTLPLLPSKIVKTVYKSAISRVVAVPDAERAFWRGYLDEIFEHRLTKADVLSYFRTGADTLKRYAFDRVEAKPWGGEVLIIGGAKDPVSTETDRAKLADFYPQARLCVIPDAGHTVGIEKPEAFAAAVELFFSR